MDLFDSAHRLAQQFEIRPAGKDRPLFQGDTGDKVQGIGNIEPSNFGADWFLSHQVFLSLSVHNMCFDERGMESAPTFLYTAHPLARNGIRVYTQRIL